MIFLCKVCKWPSAKITKIDCIVRANTIIKPIRLSESKNDLLLSIKYFTVCNPKSVFDCLRFSSKCSLND